MGGTTSRRADSTSAAAVLTPGQAATVSLDLLTELGRVGQRIDLDHHADKPPLTWYVELRSPTGQLLSRCDPATGALTAVPQRPPVWPAEPDPPELQHATAVLWVQGTGQARVSAAVHTAWFVAASRGFDAGVVMGLEKDPAGTTRVAALTLGDPPP
jgi:hypothetical protein